MAVLFPNQPVGYVLKVDKPAELLQGFLNIQTAENVNTGELTQANLVNYGKKQFFAVDPNSSVAGYLSQNFAAIAKLDGNGASISASDLVQLRQGLPTPPVTPPPTQPPVNQTPIYGMLLSLLQMMMQMMTSIFGQRQAV